jgi:hypothetical protein
MIEARPLPTDTKLEILPERDPRLATGTRTQQQRLAQLSPAQRAALVLERYPQLRALPNCDWQRLSVQATFSILYGESSRHFARLELATLGIVLASAVSASSTRSRLIVAPAASSTCCNNGSASPRRRRSRWMYGKPGAATRTSCGR